MATDNESRSRRRKPFAYPGAIPSALQDSDVLDETEQDDLIHSFETADSTTNDFYRRVSLFVPGICIFFFLVDLFSARSVRHVLDDVGSIASLIATGYILLFIPAASSAGNHKGKQPAYLFDARGPVERYLPAFNLALTVLLALGSLVAWRRGEYESALLKSLPALIYGMIMAIRAQLVEVDVGELKRARYGYKGA